MFIIQAVISALVFIVQAVATILMWIVIAHAVLTMLLSPYHPYVQMLSQAADPLLKPFRRWRLSIGVLDFTPLIVVVLLQLIQSILVRLLTMASQSLGS